MNENAGQLSMIGIACAVLLAANLVVTLAVNGIAGAASFVSPQYEYTWIAPDDEALEPRLNEAGDLGWQVVHARRAVTEGEARYEFLLQRAK